MVTSVLGDCPGCEQYSQSSTGLWVGGNIQRLTRSHLALKVGLNTLTVGQLCLGNLHEWKIHLLPG